MLQIKDTQALVVPSSQAPPWFYIDPDHPYNDQSCDNTWSKMGYHFTGSTPMDTNNLLVHHIFNSSVHAVYFLLDSFSKKYFRESLGLAGSVVRAFPPALLKWAGIDTIGGQLLLPQQTAFMQAIMAPT